MTLSHRPFRAAGVVALAASAAYAALALPAAQAESGSALAAGVAAGDESVVIDKGHVDIGPKLIDGTWRTALRDDTVNPPVWRPLEDVVLRVTDAAKTPVPSGEEYSFLNLEGNSTPWVIPQTQNPDVVWAGWNTQDPEAARLMGRGTNLIINSSTGPAPVTVFLQDGGFAAPRVLWDTASSSAEPVWMEVNSHVHMNWVFPKPGQYAFNLSMTADADDPALDASGTLRVVVGSDTPAPAQAAAVATTSPSTSAGALSPTSAEAAVTAAPTPDDSAASTDSNTTAVVAGTVGGVAILGAVIGGVLWRQRQARAQSERHFAESR